ncbi:hypothetical protein V8G54_008889 [Vigna mungo]|uniref:Uncharacterized protein n=1 Tax=Vigna mungo TaxID=3915 RepID=A0AAQ3P6D0_VIGMU
MGFCFSIALKRNTSRKNSHPLLRPSLLPRRTRTQLRSSPIRNSLRAILSHRPRPIGAQSSKHKAHGQGPPVTIIGLLARHERRERRNRKPVERPLAILAPQATTLAIHRVLEEKVTVRTCSPETRRFDRTGDVSVVQGFLNRVG